jgi:hypothetical protein
MRTRLLTFFLLAVLLVPGLPQTAAAQIARAATGAGIGAAGGVVITVSIVVARARWQGEYLESIDDLIHWQSAPMLLTPAVGVAFGLAGTEPLVASIVGSASGMLLGAAVGAGLGWVSSSSPEWPWAGGVIGAGAGMVIGGLTLGTRAWLRQRGGSADGDPPAAQIGVRLPL